METKGVILKYLTRTSAELREHPEALKVFEEESRGLEAHINDVASAKCSFAFMAGAIITAGVFVGVFYYSNRGGF